jgi:hypothetical protein
MNTTRIRVAVATAAIAATVLTPSVASANQADTLRTGSCSIGADWKLKLSPENRRIEVEYQVDANRRGQRWRVSLFHDGRRVMRTVRTTQGLSGSFTLRDVQANRGGVDHIRARAVRLGDGQVCAGRASF